LNLNLEKPPLLWGSRSGLSTMSSSSLGVLEDTAVQREAISSTTGVSAVQPWWQYMGLLPGLSMVTVLHAAASGCQVSEGLLLLLLHMRHAFPSSPLFKHVYVHPCA
jgi:hypothetical protein